MAAQLHYLTVQDILWINLQVTGKVNHFSFAKLEEATFYQYAYGDSRSVVPQAARFLLGFPKMHPIEAGNDATTFIACLTFLKINAMAVDLHDGQALAWYESAQSRNVAAQDAIKSIAKPSLDHHAPVVEVRKVVRNFLSEYPCTVLNLAASPPHL